ncbi:MAG: ATP-binding protein, partial [Pseudomonadota bacterium]
KKFLFFLCVLFVSIGSLVLFIIQGNSRLSALSSEISEMQSEIDQHENFLFFIDRMIRSHRSFVITDNPDFFEVYKEKEQQADTYLEKKQDIDIKLHEDYMLLKNLLLENRRKNISFSLTLQNINQIDEIYENIQNVSYTHIDKHKENIETLEKLLDKRRNHYLITLLSGVILGSLALLFLNIFLIRSQNREQRTKAYLEESNQRFVLAMEGTRDGIFDWDIKNDEVIVSKRYFEMLGYEPEYQKFSLGFFLSLLHPDDVTRVKSAVDDYLQGKVYEYNVEFRMKSKTDHWVWIQSRGKALRDKDGKPVRIVGAHTDISHLKYEQERLEKEKTIAEHANESKRKFLSHMSHEIRTPLTAISGIIEILNRDIQNFDPKQIKLISTLQNSTSSLKHLINDILDASKIESGELSIKNKEFSFDLFIKDIVSIAKSEALEKDIHFSFDNKISKDFLLFSDEKRIRQILINLLDNAVKFTNSGGDITLKIFENNASQKQNIVFEVIDTGIGIDNKNIDVIFERFFQLDSDDSKKYQGTGLGLSISRYLARQMGGDLKVESQLDKGSKFSLTLPIQKDTENFDIDEKINSLIKGPVKVLIIEDHEANSLVLGCMLDDFNIEYDISYSAQDGLEAFKEQNYDFVFMDLQMPDIDGLEATRLLREYEGDRNLKHTPIIGMTAKSDEDDCAICLEQGMDSYISKPINSEILKEEIFKVLTIIKKS